MCVSSVENVVLDRLAWLNFCVQLRNQSVNMFYNKLLEKFIDEEKRSKPEMRGNFNSDELNWMKDGNKEIINICNIDALISFCFLYIEFQNFLIYIE